MATETLKPSTQPIPDPPAATDGDEQKFKDKVRSKVNELGNLVNGLNQRIESLETRLGGVVSTQQHRMILIEQITKIEMDQDGNVYARPTPQHALLARLKRELEFAYTGK